MAFADNLLTGYRIGSSMRGRYDEKKRQEGMKDAVGMIEEPDLQNEQEAMLEEQTLGFDEMDAQQWQPTTTDWVGIREKGAQRILDSGGSLEDVQAFQDHLTARQHRGMQENAAMAADAMERGDMTNAARHLDNAYGYAPNRTFSQTANVDGQLMSFIKDEETGELLAEPMPMTPDRIRRMAQAYQDPAVFAAGNWDRYLAEENLDLDKRKVEEAEKTGKTTRDLNRVKTARGAEGEIGYAGGGGSGTGTGGSGAVHAGWKNTELNAIHDDWRAQQEKYNPDSADFSGIPTSKQDIYGTEDEPNSRGWQLVNRNGGGIIDVNAGISLNKAEQASETLTRLQMQGEEVYGKFMASNARISDQSPTGAQVRIGGQWVNMPYHLAPKTEETQAAMQAYQQKSGAGSRGVTYQKKPRLDMEALPLEENYGRPKQGVPPQPTPSQPAPAVSTKQQAPTASTQPPAAIDAAPKWREQRASAINQGQPQLPQAGGLPTAPQRPAPQGLAPGESMGTPRQTNPVSDLLMQLREGRFEPANRKQARGIMAAEDVISEVATTFNPGLDDVQGWLNELSRERGPAIDRARAILKEMQRQLRAGY